MVVVTFVVVVTGVCGSDFGVDVVNFGKTRAGKGRRRYRNVCICHCMLERDSGSK